MDRLLAMQVFVRVVEANGFTRAAESLQMPKASVTTLIQQLEGRLGIKLLNRTTRHVSVTADGAAYYERCVRILGDVEETEQALGKVRRAPAGRLRVDVPAAAGRHVFAPALPSFFERYPDIRLEMGCTDRPVDLLEEGVDCVVRGGLLPDSGLVARRVGELEMVTCATPGYLDRYGTPQTPADLARHRHVNYFSSKTGRILEFDFARNGERLAFVADGPVAVNDGDAYVALGRAGLGIMQVPRYMVRKDLADGRLLAVLPEWHSDPLPVHVMYPQNRHLSAKVRVFVDWVAEVFADLQKV